MYGKRIKLFDIVTSEAHLNGVYQGGQFYRVIGILRFGELLEFEGLWQIQSLKTDEITECLGKFLTVWKPEGGKVENISFVNSLDSI